jgi:hypothetical protein
MDRMDASSKPAEGSARRRQEETADDWEASDDWETGKDWYVGVDLAPTLESLVPWDVSARARREQARLSSAAYRIPRGVHGGY